MRWWSIIKTDADFKSDNLVEGSYAYYDLFADEIRIQHPIIYQRLKKKLGRVPTDEELMEFIKRMLMHEGGHAAHYKSRPQDFLGDDSLDRQKLEAIAYRLQFPESLYLAIKELLKHPTSYDKRSAGNLSRLLRYYDFKPNSAVLNNLILWVDGLAKKAEDKEKLIRLEITQRKRDKAKRALPTTLEQAKLRYGRKHGSFLAGLNWP